MFNKVETAIVTPATYQLWPLGKERKGEPLMVGTQEDFYNAGTQLSPDCYVLYAPHDEAILFYGDCYPVQKETTKNLEFIVQAISDNTFEENKSQINKIMQENGAVREHILYEIYCKFISKSTPLSSIIEQLGKLKPTLSYLVLIGAEVWLQWGRRDRIYIFRNIAEYGLNTEAFSYGVLSSVGIDSTSSHASSAFEEMFYLCDKADINARRRVTKFGTYLHWFLAFEMPCVPKLIELFESISRKYSHNPKAQFNYEAVDGYGNTPLLIALNTRNIIAVVALLKLQKYKNKPVGINIPNREGLTPLHFAVILGMKEIVGYLKDLGADFNARDNQGKTVWDHVTLSQDEKEAKIYKLLSDFMHPLRANVSTTHQHSELYLILEDGAAVPACLYEPGDTIKTGDEQKQHFVILSNCSPHKARLDRVRDIIKKQAETGDTWAEKQLSYIEKQIDDIRYRNKFDALVSFLKTKKEKNQLAAKVWDHMAGLLPTPLSYQKILNSTRNFVSSGSPQTERTLALLQGINKAIDETPANLSEFHTCLKEQAKVEALLVSYSPKQAPAEEKLARDSKNENPRKATEDNQEVGNKLLSVPKKRQREASFFSLGFSQRSDNTKESRSKKSGVSLCPESIPLRLHGRAE